MLSDVEKFDGVFARMRWPKSDCKLTKEEGTMTGGGQEVWKAMKDL